MRRNGDRGQPGGDREILDNSYGFHRTGARWLPDRWYGMPGGTTDTAPFDPTTIAGLKAWYKADAITTPGFIIRRPNQQPGDVAEPKDEIEPRAINDGDPVNTWPDSSGTGNHVSIAGSGMSSPTFRATAGPNAKPCVQFDGVNNGLYVPGAAGFTAIPQPDTVIVVYDTGNPLTYNLSSQILNPDNIHVGMYAATSVNSTRTLVANQFIIHSTVFNDPSSSIYINGTLLVGPTSCGAQPITGISINNYGPALGPSAGKVCELLIYNSALSTTDRQNVEAYLKAKYAIP